VVFHAASSLALAAIPLYIVVMKPGPFRRQ
jgi:hypothetical protein